MAMKVEFGESNVVSKKDFDRIVREVLSDMSELISKTLGPFGANTLVTEPYASAPVTPSKDGYRCMQRVQYNVLQYDTIYRIIRDVSTRMNVEVGDGTTSGIVISNEFYKNITKYLKKHWYNKLIAKNTVTPFGADLILKEIEKVVEKYLKEYKYIDTIQNITKDLPDDVSVKVRSNIYKKVATVSANNDSTIGELVSKVYAKSKSGYMFVDTDRSDSDETVVFDELGFEFPSGHIARQMATESDGTTALYDDPMYLLVDGPLLDYDLNAIGTFVNKVCIAMKRPLVIMASEYSQAAINWFIQLRSGVQVGESEELVRIPILAIIVNTANELGNERLRDLEAALGAKALPTKEGKLLDPPNANTILSYLGRSSKIKTVPFYCRIIGAQGDECEIAGRVAEIQKEIAAKSDSAQDETVGYERVESLKRRIAMLNGEMCSIKVGGIGYKEKEMKRLLVEDAVYATKATIDKGITIGGNVSIYQCINTYRNNIENEITANLIKAKASIIIGNNEKDIKKVVSKLLDIVSTSFLSAYHNVLMNAFDNNHKVNKIINEIKKSQPNAISFNIVKGEYEEFDRNNHSVNQVLGTVNYLPDLIVPGNTDIELMKSVFGIIGIFITSNQFMTFHNGPAKK